MRREIKSNAGLIEAPLRLQRSQLWLMQLHLNVWDKVWAWRVETISKIILTLRILLLWRALGWMRFFLVWVDRDVTASFFELHPLLLGQEHLEGVHEDSAGFDHLDDVDFAHEPLACDLKISILAIALTALTGSQAHWYETTQVVLRILKYTWPGKAWVLPHGLITVLVSIDFLNPKQTLDHVVVEVVVVPHGHEVGHSADEHALHAANVG